MPKYYPPKQIDSDCNLDEFDCEEESLNRWLKEKSLKNHLSKNSKTYVVCDEERVIAYYSIHVGSVFHKNLSAKDKRNSPNPISAIVLARLAVDKLHKKKGLSLDLIQDLYLKVLKISDIGGARYLIVNALNSEIVNYYVNLGFKVSKTDPLLLILPISKIEASFK